VRTTMEAVTAPHRRRPALGPVALLTFLAALATVAPRETQAQQGARVQVVEATIGELHREMLAGRLTARALVEAYLARIEAYDRKGPSLNAIRVVNPGALARADSLDAELRRTGALTGPLHGIPVIVKDNYDVVGFATTAGSASLLEAMPADDAFQVRKLREAGAIVLAKSNMAEFAFTPYETVGTAWHGYTFNPYALNRVTAGSSGGTAAAVAASFGTVGLGTDTGNSIRGPSAHQSLVGIRSTMGLTSRDGIVPLYLDRDVGGPMTRTVEDAVRVFDVLARSDPADPVTREADTRRPASYLDALVDDIQGTRIGVSREITYTETADPEVMARFEEAVADLRRLGAVVVDDVPIPGLDSLRRGPGCPRFRYDLENWLATLPDPPVRTLAEIEEKGDVHVTVMGRVRSFLDFEGTPEGNADCQRSDANEELLRQAVRRAMGEADVVALIYPTWNNPPRLVGDLDSPHGNNSATLSPPTGFPALTVPMGFVQDGALPVGLQIFGDAWSEPTLITIAYAYEQATRHRKPPSATPPLGR